MKLIMPTLGFAALLAAASGSALAEAPRAKAMENARVFIIEPKDGATVSPTFTVKFGISGMEVAPAGTDAPNTGHHHLLIDQDTLPAMDKVIPATDKIIHFGGGQTETELTLAPGKHTLQLLLGDKGHVPFDPPLLSDKITVTVE